MGRIINTFKKGSTKAKLYLALTFATGFLCFVFVILSLVLSEVLFFFGAIIMAFIAISLAQTFTIHETDIDEERNVNPTDVDFLNGLITKEFNPDGQTDELVADEAMQQIQEEVLEGKTKKEKTKKEKTKKEKTKKDKTKKDKTKKDKTKKDKSKKEKVKKEKSKKEKYANKSNLYDGHPEFLEEDVENDIEAVVEKAQPTEEELAENAEVISEVEAKSYTRKKIKKTLHKYKVKRDHRTVMIDNCKKYNINQTPAYVWVSDKTFNILLIEKEPRHLQMPVYSLREMKYLKKQPANPDIDFGVYKGNNLLADIFGPYVPDYTHSTVMDDLTAYKNLYGIGQGIYFTNRSAKNIMDLLPVEFIVEDKVTTSNKVNVYFKDTYKSNILLRDNVIDANGYADKISNILDSMAKSSISQNEFKETLKLMIKNKLITEEFASYYQDVRDKQAR